MEMARVGAGLGMRLLGWTRRASAERARHGVALVSLEDLFAAADVVTLHLAYTPESHGLISRALLERMKPEATREAASSMLRIAVATVEAFARGERLHVVNGV